MEFSEKIRTLYELYKIEILFLAGAISVLSLSSLLFFSQNKPEQKPLYSIKNRTPSPTLVYGYIDISGAVVSPDIYQVTTQTRLKDVIEKSGGLTEEADIDFFRRNFNLARIVQDQEKYYIPSRNEISPVQDDDYKPDYVTTRTPNNNETERKIYINDASKEELETIAGIGPTTAEKIISNRPYESIDELLQKKIVNKTVFEHLKNSAQI